MLLTIWLLYQLFHPIQKWHIDKSIYTCTPCKRDDLIPVSHDIQCSVFSPAYSAWYSIPCCRNSNDAWEIKCFDVVISHTLNHTPPPVPWILFVETLALQHISIRSKYVSFSIQIISNHHVYRCSTCTCRWFNHFHPLQSLIIRWSLSFWTWWSCVHAAAVLRMDAPDIYNGLLFLTSVQTYHFQLETKAQ